MKPIALKLHWQILIALLLAVIIGLVVGKDSAIFGLSVLTILQFTGSLFLNALKMLIVPLVVSSIITGMAGIGDGGCMNVSRRCSSPRPMAWSLASPSSLSSCCWRC
jgi:Na+/H+-dicarboxylate symporter